ncbi:sensor domain-containing protein [Mycobacterium kansasii]
MSTAGGPGQGGETTKPPRFGSPQFPAGAPPQGPPGGQWRGPLQPPAAPWQGPPGPPPSWQGPPDPPPFPYRPGRQDAMAPTRYRPPRRRWHWWVGGTIAVVAAVLVITLVVLGHSDSHPTPIQATSSTRGSASARPAPTTSPSPNVSPTAPALDIAALPSVLGSPDQVGKTLNNVVMDPRPVSTSLTSGVSISPATCGSAVAPALESTYASSGYTGVASRGLLEAKAGRHKVIQAVVAFPDAAAAQSFYAQQLSAWRGCRLTDVTVSYTNGNPDNHAKVTVVTDADGVASTVLLPAGVGEPQDSECGRAMSAQRNIVVDVRACGPNTITAAPMLVRAINDNIINRPGR